MPNYCIRLDGDTIVQMREDSRAEPGEIVFVGELPNIPEHMRACHLAFDGHALQWVDDGTEEPPAPTHSEIEQARAAAYRATVDPITCEIQRLRDMCGTDEEIAEAEARREAAVAAIKAQYPYPEDEVSTVDSPRL